MKARIAAPLAALALLAGIVTGCAAGDRPRVSPGPAVTQAPLDPAVDHDVKVLALILTFDSMDAATQADICRGYRLFGPAETTRLINADLAPIDRLSRAAVTEALEETCS